jgi:hypothetical protein
MANRFWSERHLNLVEEIKIAAAEVPSGSVGRVLAPSCFSRRRKPRDVAELIIPEIELLSISVFLLSSFLILS